MKKLFFLSLLLVPIALLAQPKAGYYNAAVGKSDAALKTQLYSIISADYVDNGYGGLYTTYTTSDNTATGKVWDMYSTCTWTHGNKQCGDYKIVCDCYNREHSIPQSWFGEASPMRNDAFHVYPTDGKVNGQRSNYPYGECANGSSLSGGKGRLGGSTFAGYSGTVFEPDDEFKGDFARTYFYFATRYQNIMTSIGGDSFNKTTFPSLSTWSINLFLKWHRQDPVSEKETVRNNAVEVRQKNRNPFIDYPALAEFIWGTRKGELWSLVTNTNESKVEFSITPNPVQSELTIKSDELNLSYIIYNLNGQPLQEEQLNLSCTVSINNLENGMYLLQLKSGNKKSIQKFIVNK